MMRLLGKYPPPLMNSPMSPMRARLTSRLYVWARPNNMLSPKQPDNLQLHSSAVVAANCARNGSLKIRKFLDVLLEGAPRQLCTRFALCHDYRFIVLAKDVNLLAQRLGAL